MQKTRKWTTKAPPGEFENALQKKPPALPAGGCQKEEIP